MPYGLRASESRLRCMAAERIDDEGLPVIFPAIFRPRHGSDEMCQVCDRRIDRFRIEYQVTDPRDGYELAFHLLCYRVWQVECRDLLALAHAGTFEWPTTRRSSTHPRAIAARSGRKVAKRY